MNSSDPKVDDTIASSKVAPSTNPPPNRRKAGFWAVVTMSKSFISRSLRNINNQRQPNFISVVGIQFSGMMSGWNGGKYWTALVATITLRQSTSTDQRIGECWETASWFHQRRRWCEECGKAATEKAIDEETGFIYSQFSSCNAHHQCAKDGDPSPNLEIRGAFALSVVFPAHLQIGE